MRRRRRGGLVVMVFGFVNASRIRQEQATAEIALG